MEALDEGKPEEAAKEIDDARQMILSSPAAASSTGAGILGDQASKLESFRKTLKDSDAQKAKKSIQYENYKVQKQIE
ncbi:MAG: VWFA domain-containing protein [Bacteroidetes bacterium]|nr:VWFA domain-containing protein [Bacteroidota bacterium]